MSFLKKLVSKAVKDVVKEVSKPSNPSFSKPNNTSVKQPQVVNPQEEYKRLQGIIDDYEALNPGVYKFVVRKSSESTGISLSNVYKLFDNEIRIPKFVDKVSNLGDWEKEENPIRIVFEEGIQLTTGTDFFKNSKFNILDVSNLDLTVFPSLRSLFRGANIKTLTGLDKWKFGKHNDLTQLFFSSKIDTYEGINEWDISNIEDFLFIFRDIETTNLDISKWKFDKIITTPNTKNGFGKSGGLFSGAKIKNFGCINNWNMSKVTSMVSWFSHAKIDKLDLSKWDVSNVEHFTFLFEGFDGTVLGLENWNTSSATNMLKTFMSSGIVNEIDLSNWNTSRVTTMHSMFTSCTLKNLDLSRWNTSNVNDMSNMFSNCKMESVGDLSNWNVHNVKNFEFMFSKSIFGSIGEVGNWNVCNADVTQMFAFSKLTSIGSISRWSNNVHQEYMFQGSNIK